MTYFISGHRDITEQEFKEHYIPQINRVLELDKYAHFRIGDWKGCDDLAFNYLLDRIKDFQIITIHCIDCVRLPKYSEKQYPYIMPYKCETYDECDRTMTEYSDFHIAWIRPGREDSHTAKNIKRRYGFYK